MTDYARAVCNTDQHTLIQKTYDVTLASGVGALASKTDILIDTIAQHPVAVGEVQYEETGKTAVPCYWTPDFQQWRLKRTTGAIANMKFFTIKNNSIYIRNGNGATIAAGKLLVTACFIPTLTAVTSTLPTQLEAGFIRFVAAQAGPAQMGFGSALREEAQI